MTREETIKILAILKAAYPASYKGMTKQEATGTIAVWAAQFAGTPATVVMIAIQKLIATNTFPPTISEVKSKIRGMYWEAWQAISMHKNGIMPLDARRYAETEAIMNACSKYNNSGSNEPTLAELIGGVQKYIAGGEDNEPKIS